MSEEHAPYNAGHDPVTTLRLELHREKSRADAFEAALRKEVLAVVGHEIAKAKACDTEIARLKREVELWQLRSENWQKLASISMAEVEKLKGGRP